MPVRTGGFSKMGRIRCAIRLYSRFLAFLGMFLLLPMMFLSTADVVLRKFWSVTVPGTMEISSLLLALFVLLGLSYTHQCRGHVQIGLLVDRLPETVRAGVEFFLGLLSVSLLSLLAIGGWQVALEERTVTDMLRLPLAPFRMILVVGVLSFLLELLLDLFDAFHTMRTQK